MSEEFATSNNQEKNFDQFYTADSVAERCLLDLLSVLNSDSSGYSLDDIVFLEPSAGGGAFIRALEKVGLRSYYACDIDPKHDKVEKHDFLNDDISDHLPEKRGLIVIGNPPVGKRARMAAAFINRAFNYTDTVAFVLPLQFQKYSAQNKIIGSARLVFDKNLAPDSFVFNGKAYTVRCCFQVWTTRKFGKDIRLRFSPITKHKDFDMWQYNNTKEAEKYFDKEVYGWDFAIPRQGYKDYTIKETDPDKMDHRTQWIFFKAKSPEVLDRLYQIDYDKLSKKNIAIPGFGKADVINEYKALFGDKPLVIEDESQLIGEESNTVFVEQKGKTDFSGLPLSALLN